MQDDIVGICRFSVWVRCDWVRTMKAPENEAKFLAEHALNLFWPERLARRFHAFENLC
ncbi:glycosyltransferase [Paracoccus aestuariivivens]|uniref:Uncharacterized protein n=1 Tax=Paracoccus aestuariivivens TaxID=1820333 RepID=A0A6L6J8Q2_9RHOB|nr:glycosyltransferase [Paracoccus aestuariivivens]MTH77545.1 hypothetical protein [Paracoccus aestuariivivens]